jgi:hypothetical protein
MFDINVEQQASYDWQDSAYRLLNSAETGNWKREVI